jgi:predicted nucleic acid-binding protein
VFVDTNILVYSTRRSSSFHARATEVLERGLASEPRLAISRQILREYLAVVTRPGGNSEPLQMVDALADVGRFSDLFDILEDGPAVTTQLVQLCRTVAVAGRQVHDANIVATMLAHGETRLLTSNRGDFKRFAPAIEVVEP